MRKQRSKRFIFYRWPICEHMHAYIYICVCNILCMHTYRNALLFLKNPTYQAILLTTNEPQTLQVCLKYISNTDTCQFDKANPCQISRLHFQKVKETACEHYKVVHYLKGHNYSFDIKEIS